jgi:predicted methyltransferase
MLSQIVQDRAFPLKSVSYADAVAYCRPSPLRDFDQIYMMSGDMLAQVELMKEYLAAKRVVFLGDGDGMSMLFGLLAAKDEIQKSQSMLVLDFDKRILANIERFGREAQFDKNKVTMRTQAYNVIDPVPEDLIGKGEFFYINPPYGSKNAGQSTIVWLHRCMDLCTYSCSGCLVVPYDEKHPWSQEAMIAIQRFLLSNGFVIRDMVAQMHSYHLKDNPTLQSATVIVDRVGERVVSPYRGKTMQPEEVVNLYGSPRRLPHYIEVDDPEFRSGKPDYDWVYGHEGFWRDDEAASSGGGEAVRNVASTTEAAG